MDDFDLYDVWDIEDNREDSIFLEQALISKKNQQNAYSVDRQYINSKAYHDKFERLPVNDVVQESLYKQAGRLLEFMDGKDEERLIAINALTGELIVDNFERDGYAKNTAFTTSEYQKILDCPNMVILVHNHSRNGRPSAAYLLSYLNNKKVKLSLALCHDGTLYGICGVNPAFRNIFEDSLKEAKMKTTDMEEAKILTTTRLYRMNEKLSNKRKIFDVRKL